MSFIDDFADRIHDQYHVFPGVPPLGTVRPGDYGKLEGHVWQRAGSLATMPGIPMPVSQSSPRSGDSEWKTSRATAMRFNAKTNFGDGYVSAAAGISVSFASEAESYFWMPAVRYIEIANLATVMDEILRRANLDAHDPLYWDADEYVVVSGVYAAPNLVQIMSQGSNSSVRFEASGTSKSSELLDAALDFSVTSTDTTSQRYVGKVTSGNEDEYFTPLIELQKIHWNIFGHRWWGPAH
jgi:hypothetical protein